MKLTVSNRDVTDSLGADIVKSAAARADRSSPRFHVPEVSALSLRGCASENEYFTKFMKLLRMRHGASTGDFDIQRSPGPVGAAMQRVRGFLWRLLVYQHDRMIFQQNLINEMLIHAIEFDVSRRNAEIAELRREIEALKKIRAEDTAHQ